MSVTRPSSRETASCIYLTVATWAFSSSIVLRTLCTISPLMVLFFALTTASNSARNPLGSLIFIGMVFATEVLSSYVIYYIPYKELIYSHDGDINTPSWNIYLAVMAQKVK